LGVNGTHRQVDKTQVLSCDINPTSPFLYSIDTSDKKDVKRAIIKKLRRAQGTGLYSSRILSSLAGIKFYMVSRLPQSHEFLEVTNQMLPHRHLVPSVLIDVAFVDINVRRSKNDNRVIITRYYGKEQSRTNTSPIRIRRVLDYVDN
jgi:hypothetical protein